MRPADPNGALHRPESSAHSDALVSRPSSKAIGLGTAPTERPATTRLPSSTGLRRDELRPAKLPRAVAEVLDVWLTPGSVPSFSNRRRRLR